VLEVGDVKYTLDTLLMQCVYLLQEIDCDGVSPTELYKIGQTTKDVHTRKRQYQAGNPRHLRPIHTIHVSDAQEIETQLHRLWTDYRVRAGGGDEWFNFQDVDINDVIDSMNEYNNVPAYTAPIYPSETVDNSQYSYSHYSSGSPEMFSGIGASIVTILTVFFALVVVASQSSKCIPAQVAVPEFKSANLRSAPTDGDEFVIDNVKNGTMIMVCETSPGGKWRRVKTLNSVSAWIATGLLK
jgi:hypothetical protein